MNRVAKRAGFTMPAGRRAVFSRLAGHAAGFTMVETMVSAAVLSIIVFAAVTASHTAMRATSGVVSIDAADGRARHVLDRMRALFLSASVGTLQGIPVVAGTVPEPMSDAVDYSDIRFRTVSGWTKGAPVYVPVAANAPFRVYRTVDAKGRGSLVLDNGHTTELVADVDRAVFRRIGRRLQIEITTSPGQANAVHSVELELVLMVP